MAGTKPTNSCLGLVVSILTLGTVVFLTLWAYVTSRYGWKIYLEIFSHFQLQYFILCLISLGILILLKRKRLIVLGFFCCALLSAQIVPWYLPANGLNFSGSKSDLRVLIANINTQNKSYQKVLDLVRLEKPDLAVFMEVDQAWQDQLDTLSDLLPYSSGQTNPYNLGLLVYSNKSLTNTKIEFFGTEKNTSVVTEIMVGTQPITVLATHPFPPVKSSFFHSRNQQLDLIRQYLEDLRSEAARSQPPHQIILAGDLNTTMWSPYYQRLVRKTNLKNARMGFGILPTWPTPGTYPTIPRALTPLFSIPIDHCLLSHGLDVTDIHIGTDTGSDHRPLIVDVRVP